jgi:hypothetical protein
MLEFTVQDGFALAREVQTRRASIIFKPPVGKMTTDRSNQVQRRMSAYRLRQQHLLVHTFSTLTLESPLPRTSLSLPHYQVALGYFFYASTGNADFFYACAGFFYA